MSHLKAVYYPGVRNVLADRASRIQEPGGLQWLPMGNRQFQNIVRMLPAAFLSFLFDDTYVFDSMPLATDIAISAAASDALQHLEMEWRQSAVAALSQYHFPDFADVDDLRDGVPTS